MHTLRCGVLILVIFLLVALFVLWLLLSTSWRT